AALVLATSGYVAASRSRRAAGVLLGRAKQGSALRRRDACNLVGARAGHPQRLSVRSDGAAHPSPQRLTEKRMPCQGCRCRGAQRESARLAPSTANGEMMPDAKDVILKHIAAVNDRDSNAEPW